MTITSALSAQLLPLADLPAVRAHAGAAPTGPTRNTQYAAPTGTAGCACGQNPCRCDLLSQTASIADRVELSPQATAARELTDEEQAQIRELKQRDQEVRQHEAAHLAAAGSYARGGASYEYETGPDGKRYAVGGEVQIDTSPVPGDPDATIRKMQTVRQAALAPHNPSAQDRRVAAQAQATINKARGEKARKQDRTDEPANTPGRAENASANTVEPPFARSAGGSPAAAYDVARLDARAARGALDLLA
jgi:hypothetical protein